MPRALESSVPQIRAAAGTGAQARAAPELRHALRAIDLAVSRFAMEARMAA